jgi:murein DD-endopeptidase MepM/ murein hydrolase activator NlpD
MMTEKIEEVIARTWDFPIHECPGIPINHHPGAYGFQRWSKTRRVYSHHTGVDLYSVKGAEVRAVEDGVVVGVEPFTGPQDNTPWWLDTDAILVEGNTGVVCYGEVTPEMEVGQNVKRGDIVARVSTVLPEGKHRPDIPGHSRSMLHLELYQHGVTSASTSWDQGREELGMRDPTPLLIESFLSPGFLLW